MVALRKIDGKEAMAKSQCSSSFRPKYSPCKFSADHEEEVDNAGFLKGGDEMEMETEMEMEMEMENGITDAGRIFPCCLRVE